MKGYKLISCNSSSMFTPQKYRIINQKLNLKIKPIKKQNEPEKIINTISNKTNYSSFRPRELTLSSNQLTTDTHSNKKISQFLLINNRYNDILHTNIIPSIKNNTNNIKIKNMRNTFNKTTNCFPLNKLKTKSENKKLKINLINTEELNKISTTLFSSFKSTKKIKQKKNINLSLNDFKINSLLYYLNKSTKFKDSEIENRYKPIIKEFFCKKDYLKFASKSEKFIKTEELKMLYKDTRLIKAIFDYINNSFSKLRFYQAVLNQKKMNELLEKKKKEKYYYRHIEKEKILALNELLQIKKLVINKNRNSDILLSIKNKNKIKDIN